MAAPAPASADAMTAQRSEHAAAAAGSSVMTAEVRLCTLARRAAASASTCPPRTSASGNILSVAIDIQAPARTSGLLDDACRGAGGARGGLGIAHV